MAFARPHRLAFGPASCPGAEGESVDIPGGWFLFGPGRERMRVDALTIDRRPVTNGQYSEYARATAARVPPHFHHPGFLARKRDHPVVGISLTEALAYARWRGADLPTEVEWERAARGTEGRVYPWGDDFDPRRCNTAVSGLRDTTHVDAYPSGTSPEGCRDLCGNVWEWTRTETARGLYVVKGGSWYDPPAVARADARFTARAGFASASLGFRCVRRSVALPPLRLAEARPRESPVANPGSEEGDSLVGFLRERAEVALSRSPARPPVLRGFDAGAALRAASETLSPAAPVVPPSLPPPPNPTREDEPERPRRLALPGRWRTWIAILLGANVAFFVLRVLLG